MPPPDGPPSDDPVRPKAEILTTSQCCPLCPRGADARHRRALGSITCHSANQAARQLGVGTPIFVCFNAPFDWAFINYYFHRFLGSNPFGFTALDIKVYYMGATGCPWSDTRSSQIHAVVKPRRHSDHTALHDAQYQAELFRLIRDRQGKMETRS